MKQEAKNINKRRIRRKETGKCKKPAKNLGPSNSLFKRNYTIHTFDPQISNINKAQARDHNVDRARSHIIPAISSN